MRKFLFVLFGGTLLAALTGCGDSGLLQPLRELSDKLAPTAAQKAIDRQKAASGLSDESFLKVVVTQKPEAIIAMLNKGADPNAHDEQGQSALSLYLQTKYPDVDTVDAFLRAGADVNELNSKGAPLIATACAISPRLTQVFLAHGAKVDSVYPNGMTPLMFCAISANTPQAVQLLIQAGADASYQAPNGWTAYTVAQQYNRNPAVAQALAAN